MKKKICTCIVLIVSLSMFAETEYSFNKYFNDNILKLDPIEGFYDIQAQMKTTSPYAPNNSWHDKWAIKRSPTDHNKFDIYSQDGQLYQLFSFSRIGETNVYSFTYHTTEGRAYLIDKIQFNVTLDLDLASCRKISSNPNWWGWKIVLRFDGIKSYPTSSMYENALKKEIAAAEKEYQRALENAQKKEIEEAKNAGWSGSGFALRQGYVVTNYHVVEEAKTILVKGIRGDFNTEYRAEVVATDKVNDLAIIKIVDERFNGFGTIPYNVKRSISEVGESVWTLGYPMVGVMGDEIKFTDGKISARTGAQGDMSVYQISAPIQPGNSGGALFNNNGDIIGITSSGLNRETFNSENVNYAIKTSYLYNLIESSLSLSILPQGTVMQGQPLTQKIKLAKNFVFLISCSSSLYFHAPQNPQNTQNETNKPVQETTQKNEKIQEQYNIVYGAYAEMLYRLACEAYERHDFEFAYYYVRDYNKIYHSEKGMYLLNLITNGNKPQGQEVR